MAHQRIQPPGLVDLPTFTQVIKAGGTVFVAGQVAVTPDRKVVGRGDVAAPCDGSISERPIHGAVLRPTDRHRPSIGQRKPPCSRGTPASPEPVARCPCG
jgi:hypothetical protein